MPVISSDDFPRGKGDPDFYGNPAEEAQQELKQAIDYIESFAPGKPNGKLTSLDLGGNNGIDSISR